MKRPATRTSRKLNSAQTHMITREIGIDMGHRVTHHGSKCRNLHGHRYTIQATCKGPLFQDGEQEGMVLDFGFLKDIMMQEIDAPCDHGMTLWIDDPWTPILLDLDIVGLTQARQIMKDQGYVPAIIDHSPRSKVSSASSEIKPKWNVGGKYYLVPFVPTAENLARHWFQRLQPRVLHRSDGLATLYNVKVWETPNCTATYPTSS